MRPNVASREYLRVGGGYDAPETGLSPAGGVNVDNTGNIAINGDATIDGDTEIGGSLCVNGLAHQWAKFIPADHMWPAQDIPCTGPASVRWAWLKESQAMHFAPGTVSSAVFTLATPADYDGRDLTICLYWTSVGTVGDGITWRAYAMGHGDGADLAEPIANVFETMDTLQESLYLHECTLTITPNAASPSGSLLTFAIRRNGAAATDTLPGTAMLIGARVSYS